MKHQPYILIIRTAKHYGEPSALIGISQHSTCESAERKADNISRNAKADLIGAIFEAPTPDPRTWRHVTNLAL